MQPKFDDVLRVTPSGSRVRAAGPVPLNGTEEEGYIAVWISQTQAGGQEAKGRGIGELDEKYLADSFKLARQIYLQGAPGQLDQIVAPVWDLQVKATEGKFENGPATALAWLGLRGQAPGDVYETSWTDTVQLQKS